MPSSFNPAPTHLDEVIQAQWLTTMLNAHWPDAKVHAVTVVETLITQATKVRLALEVTGGSNAIPRYICIKGILTDAQVPGTASVVETRFYREIADRLPVRVPRCIYAGLNDAGDNGVIVMADEIRAGSTFLSALTPFTVDEARGSLEQLALLHVDGWQGRALYDEPWIPRFLDMITHRPIMPLDMLQQMLNGPKGATLPAAVKDAARLQAGLETFAQQVREGPSCLVHGDAHAGNIYRSTQGYGLVDWQILQKGEWSQDVAYHLAAVLSPEDRRRHERALLDHYRARLKAMGGPDLAADTAWQRYRAAMVYGYYLWAITQKVEPAITNEFTRRLGLAVADLESFEAIGA
jgi:phosphotransferase family enzyme